MFQIMKIHLVYSILSTQTLLGSQTILNSEKR